MAKGDELLIADSVQRDRDGLRKMFEDEGYVCTAAASSAQARELAGRKFFPAAVVDLDFERTNGGLELARFLREHSRPTAVVLLTSRRSYEAAVDALRMGLVDVIQKRPDELSRLSRAVGVAVDRYRATDKDSVLLQEVRSVLDAAFKIMLSMVRRVYGEGSAGSSVARLAAPPAILIVDDDQTFLQALSQILGERDWTVAVEVSGGAGLDKASSEQFEIVAARAELADLPGSMIVKTVQSQKPKTLGLVYSAPGPDGRMEQYEQGRLEQTDMSFEGPEQLVDKLQDMVGQLAAMQQERRYLRAFRNEHGDFLKRYADLKTRLDALTR